MSKKAKPVVDQICARVLFTCLPEGRFNEIEDAGLGIESFKGPVKLLYDFIRDEVAKGAHPSVAHTETSTGITYEDNGQTFDENLEILVKRQQHRTYKNALLDVADLLEQGPNAGADYLSQVEERLARIGSEIARPAEIDPIVSFRETSMERIKTYKDLKTKGGFEGWLTPWDSMNKACQGFVNGELVLLVARPWTGKSWACSYIANDLFDQGARVLFVTMEMLIPKIMQRLDAVRYELPWSLFRNKMLGNGTELRWKDFAEKDLVNPQQETGEIFVASESRMRHVANVMDAVQQYQADVVIVDGGYRFAGFADEWSNSASVINQLQTGALSTGIPWIVTTQLGAAGSSRVARPTKQGTRININDIRYAKEWQQNADVIIGLQHTDQQLQMGLKEIHFMKVREIDSTMGKEYFLINWKDEEMDYSELTGSVAGSTMMPTSAPGVTPKIVSP